MIPGIELWTKPITADGVVATEEQQRAAWGKWCGAEMLYHKLSDALRAVGVISESRDSDPASRVADRMLQRARKAGVIRFEKGRWHLVAKEAPYA